MFMERLGDQADWSNYLQKSFAANKPWDQMAREILRADSRDEATQGAAFFIAKRLENYGQNPVDYPALTRDVGRLFLGDDLRCAQCHDHLFINDYKQRDFQGLFAFVQNAYLPGKNGHRRREADDEEGRVHVGLHESREGDRPAAARRQGDADPGLRKGKEYVRPAEPEDERSRRAAVQPAGRAGEAAAAADNPTFVRNIVNRLWLAADGPRPGPSARPASQGNPPSHPEVLDLLAKEFVEHKFDIQWLLRELALSADVPALQRAAAGRRRSMPARFLTAIEKRLSAEQLSGSMLEATGERAGG